MTSSGVMLPSGAMLTNLLDLEASGSIEDILTQTLTGPLHDFMSRPRKGIRGEMVHIGYNLVAAKHADEAQATEHCDSVADALELLHAGSLVVDDIQDGSRIRRGRLSLHEIYGLPVALNAGNWLYFFPLKKIDQLNVPAELRLKLFRDCHETLLRAHYGQAIDVGTPVTSLTRERIPEVSMAALHLKTGALMALAMKLGALLGGANDQELRAVDRFGHRFGVALQMFDDIGNLRSNKAPDKRFEDLKNQRPSFIWCAAALEYSESEFQQLADLSRSLPASAPALLDHLAHTGLIDKALARAERYLDQSLASLRETLNPDVSVLEKLNRLQQELQLAYA